MTFRHGLNVVAVALAVFALTSCSDEASTEDASTTSSAPAKAHIRGTAYTFNTPDPIAGAKVSLLEHPEISTTTLWMVPGVPGTVGPPASWASRLAVALSPMARIAPVFGSTATKAPSTSGNCVSDHSPLGPWMRRTTASNSTA